MDIFETLKSNGLIHPPKCLHKTSMQYLTITGSFAYGVSSDTSDMDIYGFAIPDKETVFPHLGGYIHGFDKIQNFEQYQQHHIEYNQKNYDLTIFNIVKYFRLVADGNPNMIDTLYVRPNCVLSMTPIGQMVKENRHIFLSKKVFHTFKGYAYSQLHKAKVKPNDPTYLDIWKFEAENGIPRSTKYSAIDSLGLPGVVSEKYKKLYETGIEKTKRFEGIKIHGVDFKFMYHIVRLLDEVEQLLETGDMDIQRSREEMKAIRRGEKSFPEIEAMFYDKEKALMSLYEKSTLPHSPDENRIKELLLACLEQHFGSLDKCIVQTDQHEKALREIEIIIEKTKRI